jgi:uncharacterized protein (UPF0333 family)
LSKVNFKKCNKGNVALGFAIVLIPLCLAVGVAVDFIRMAQLKTVLQSAADTASLAAAANPLYTESEVQKVAADYVAKNTVAEGLGKLATKVGSQTTSGGRTSVTVDVSTQMPTSFMSLGGIEELDIEVSSTASGGARSAEIYVALDMSESMNIAADPAARKALIAATMPYSSTGCEFACHYPDDALSSGAIGYNIARKNGIPLRIDNLIQAFNGFVDSVFATTSASESKLNSKMAVVGFSTDAHLLQSSTNDIEDIKDAPSQFPVKKSLNTHFERVLPAVRDMMGSQGDGSKRAPTKILLLVTDGVKWDRWDGTGGGPVDPAECKAFKDDGIKVVVVEIKYQEAAGEYWFDNYVKPFYADISPALEACASPGLYFGSDDSDIKSLNAAFTDVLSALEVQVALTK